MTETKKSEPRFVFAFDPGEKRTGFCMFKYDPDTQKADTRIMKILDPDELETMLETVYTAAKHVNNTYFVIENFRIDMQHRAGASTRMFQGKEVETIRVIGMIKLVAKWTNSKIRFQEPTILNMARKWVPFFMAKHPRDDQSAWCHGVTFMMDRNWIGSVTQVSIEGQERFV